MKTNDEIIDTLKKLTTEQNMSLSELARRTGMAKSAVSRYFNGTREFPLNRVDQFAKAVHITPEALIGISPKQNHPVTTLPFHTYQYVPADISAGVLTTVDAVAESDVQNIRIPDALMGAYAGDKDISIMHVNGKSMNHVIPDGSLIGVKRIDDASDLKDGDIVVFSEDGEDYAVKRFYNDKASQTYVFNPDSTESCYRPILRRYEDADGLSIIGRVVVYVVTL